MKLRCTAALALVGWYLMIFPANVERGPGGPTGTAAYVWGLYPNSSDCTSSEHMSLRFLPNVKNILRVDTLRNGRPLALRPMITASREPILDSSSCQRQRRTLSLGK